MNCKNMLFSGLAVQCYNIIFKQQKNSLNKHSNSIDRRHSCSLLKKCCRGVAFNTQHLCHDSQLTRKTPVLLNKSETNLHAGCKRYEETPGRYLLSQVC